MKLGHVSKHRPNGLGLFVRSRNKTCFFKMKMWLLIFQHILTGRHAFTRLAFTRLAFTRLTFTCLADVLARFFPSGFESHVQTITSSSLIVLRLRVFWVSVSLNSLETSQMLDKPRPIGCDARRENNARTKREQHEPRADARRKRMVAEGRAM